MKLIRSVVIGAVSVCLVVVGLTFAGQPASADGGPTSGYVSPAEQQRAAAKQKQLDQWQASRPDTITQDYGEVVMSLYQEPQAPYAANWCGPGSTQAIVGQWRGYALIDNYSGPEGIGPDAYMARLANTLGEYDGVQTTFDNYVRVTNQETLSSGFYVAAVLTGGFSDYTGKLDYDIQFSGRPLAPTVQANGLPGWSYNVAHWVTVKQYWVGGDTTTIGDTAGFAQGRSQSAGWYVTSLSSFYYNHIANLYNEIVW
jgi:hypothetical protein